MSSAIVPGCTVFPTIDVPSLKLVVNQAYELKDVYYQGTKVHAWRERLH